jgi:hypothetical protein
MPLNFEVTTIESRLAGWGMSVIFDDLQFTGGTKANPGLCRGSVLCPMAKGLQAETQRASALFFEAWLL